MGMKAFESFFWGKGQYLSPDTSLPWYGQWLRCNTSPQQWMSSTNMI